MIIGETGNVSAIFLSVMLIFYLILVELGNKKIKDIMLPVIITLIIIFGIVAISSVVSTWISLK